MNAHDEKNGATEKTWRPLADWDRLMTVGRMTSGISHDTNNELTNLLFLFQTIKMESHDPALLKEAEEALNIVNSIRNQIAGIRQVSLSSSAEENLSAPLKNIEPPSLSRDQILQAEKLHKLGQLLIEFVGFFSQAASRLDTFHESMRRMPKDPELESLVESAFEGLILFTSRLDALKKFVENEGRESPPTPENLDQLIDQCLKFCQFDEFLKNGVLKTDLKPVGRVMIDLGDLRQIFLHLLRNAIEAAGEKGEVTITTTRDNETAILTLTNRTTKLGKEVLEKMFSPFFTTKDQPALGLGLTIVQEKAQKWQGHLECHPVNPENISFSLILPCV